MTKRSPFRYFKTSPEIIRLAVMLYIRFPLSLRNVEDLLHERGIEISHETVRYWWNRFGPSSFGPMFAAEIRGKRVEAMRAHRHWHLDEVYVKINGGDTLPLAGGQSRRRGAGKHRHQVARSQGSPEILDEIDEAARPPRDNRDGSVYGTQSLALNIVWQSPSNCQRIWRRPTPRMMRAEPRRRQHQL
jgi:hypothetical protein